MNDKELIERLNSIAQYSLEDTNQFGYGSDNDLVEQVAMGGGGEWVKMEDIARVLGMKINQYGQLQY